MRVDSESETCTDRVDRSMILEYRKRVANVQVKVITGIFRLYIGVSVLNYGSIQIREIEPL